MPYPRALGTHRPTQIPPVTRVEIVDHLEGAFNGSPLERDDLVDAATAAGARPQVVETLRGLPERHRFHHPRELWQHLGEVPVER
ncbi:MAG: DUF2795 domain-containing protein [Acidimicrobiales bacterium]